ncbi:glutathione S-transferase family protein [Poseidonocella sedimentorum]|uniref:Putative glutathione S-transferase n=1 Tax=Poseidonocella sedimentorum TaxID=871652 RepID=A0A1I6E1D7_9RHOB|nr:glutathione S-transferase family protein [Poseidonocella sedimentorum]SFR11338.1 putative glutathione S-transferase [Poseidonocella sedimentorum]
MGLLVDGKWVDQWYDTKKSGGAFVRSTAGFRNWITADGSAGPSGEGGFPAQSGRYHLYVSYACPWAHRALIFRTLKDLEPHIGVSAVHPEMLDDGWTFETDSDGATGDRLHDLPFLRDLYLKADPKISGRVTVPVLWDTERGTIVSNESAEIIRMFNSAFNGITGNDADFCPEPLRARIDEINSRVYDTVNNGVYKAGFATTQAAYDDAVGPLFDSLEWIEGLLSAAPYLAGESLTEADWRLFTTIVRFDPVYHGHFKCNRKRIADYPAIWAWAQGLYEQPGVGETVNMAHITRHYHYSHDTINPHRIIPTGPAKDLTTGLTPRPKG